MDPEFQKALIAVLAAGSIIVSIATTLLFFAFRAFGGEKAGRGAHVALIAALVAFVFGCCLLLFRFAG